MDLGWRCENSLKRTRCIHSLCSRFHYSYIYGRVYFWFIEGALRLYLIRWIYRQTDLSLAIDNPRLFGSSHTFEITTGTSRRSWLDGMFGHMIDMATTIGCFLMTDLAVKILVWIMMNFFLKRNDQKKFIHNTIYF